MRVRSFFTNVRSQIVANDKPDPLGRYLSICLQEALRENKSLLHALFPECARTVGPVEVLKEYRYSSNNKRRADLALVGPDERALAIVEVKVKDCISRAQGLDYRRFTKVARCPLVLLSRYPLTPAERDMLGDCELRELSTNDLYRAVRRASGNGFAVTDLLARYLEENEMIYTRRIDDSLALLVNRVFVGSDRNYKVKSVDVTHNLPDTLGAVFSTLQLIGSAVRERVVLPKKLARKWMNVTVDMQYHAYASTDRLDTITSRAKAEKNTVVWVGGVGKANRWGTALYYTSLQVSNASSQTYLCVGLEVSAEKGSRMELRLITWVSPDRDEYPSEEVVRKLRYSKKSGAWDLGDEQALLEAVVRGLRKSIRNYVKYYASRLPGDCRPQCKRLAVLKKITLK